MSDLWVPVERLLPIVCPANSSFASYATKRRLSELRSGRQAYVSLRVVDRILIELHLDEWLHIRAEDGGLADIYEDGAQYGAPDTNFHADYGSEAARLRAHRETLKRRRRALARAAA